MKKTNTFVLKLLSVLLICGICLGSQRIDAAGGGGYFARFSVAASGTVNQPVAITAYLYYYRCSDGYSPASGPTWCESNGHGTTSEIALANQSNLAKITVSGSGNTLSNDQPATDASGNAYITLTSSVAETKTLNAYFPTNVSDSGKIGTATVTINAPMPPSTSSPSPSQPKVAQPTTPKPAAPVEVTPPAIPTSEIKVGSSLIKSEDKPTIKENEPIVLSGKTVANGVVTIYVFSEPKKYTTNADKDGMWTYEVSGLPPGDHHIEAEVTDPITGKTSPRAQVLAFTIEKIDAASLTSSQPKTQEYVEKRSNTLGLILGAGAIVLLVAATLLLLFKRSLLYPLMHKLHLR